MSDTLVCWKCGADLADLPLPIARLAECPACRADLHVCRLCRFYDRRAAQACTEPMAEEVKDKERANFCDYYQASPGAFESRDDSAARTARAQLEALFDSKASAPTAPEADDAARQQLEELFRPPAQRKD